jgi:hypothetical protein
MDALVIGCALGQGCDEAELVQLAVNYAHEFRCPYALSSLHMRSLETSAEQEAAKKMEARVNKVITKTIQRERPMGAMGRMAMERLSSQPTPNLRTILTASIPQLQYASCVVQNRRAHFVKGCSAQAEDTFA